MDGWCVDDAHAVTLSLHVGCMGSPSLLWLSLPPTRYCQGYVRHRAVGSGRPRRQREEGKLKIKYPITIMNRKTVTLWQAGMVAQTYWEV